MGRGQPVFDFPLIVRYPEAMSDLHELTEEILKFRNERDWEQFHTPKDLALSLVLEASEVLEHFQWKNGDELKKYLQENKSKLGEELSDVLYWVLLLSHDLGIDIKSEFKKKMELNAKKYPVEMARGKKEKYTEL